MGTVTKQWYRAVKVMPLLSVIWTVAFSGLGSEYSTLDGATATLARTLLPYFFLILGMYWVTLALARRSPPWSTLGLAVGIGYLVGVWQGAPTIVPWQIAGAVVFLLTLEYVRMCSVIWHNRANLKRVGKRSAPAAAPRAQAEPALVSRSKAVSPQPTKAEEAAYPARKPRLTFKDVVGMDDVKARILEATKAIQQPASKEHGEQRNGVLLYGEPGTGKTMFAEALAGELRLPYLAVNIGSVASRWVNQSTEQLVEVFAAARRQAPCVLFLDEFDSLAPDRATMTQTGGEETKLVNTLLAELTAIRGTKVVVVAATNYRNRCDEAAIREGRMDFKIEVPTPDLPARKHLLTQRLKRAPALEVEADVIERLARRWDGFSAARLVAVANEAMTHAKRVGNNKPGFDDFMQALRRVQGNAARLPEGTLGLADLVMPTAQHRHLSGIAARMRRIEDIERLGGTVPAGVLFFGPPGTGKTATVRALAKESGWALLTTTGMELLSKADAIDNLVKQARDLRPAIVFIDEADDVLSDRRMSSAAVVTNKLLTAMDGSAGKAQDVVFVAATNNVDLLDAAVLRGGRFTEKVEFHLPGEDEVGEFAKRWIEQCQAKFASDVTPEWVGKLLGGVAIATVSEVLQQAVNQVVTRFDEAEPVVNRSDLEYAANIVVS